MNEVNEHIKISNENHRLSNDIKELLIFYSKTNYEHYLQKNNITKINENKIDTIIENIFDEKKKHCKEFVHNSISQVYKENSPSKYTINLILNDIFEDEIIVKHNLKKKILEYQSK